MDKKTQKELLNIVCRNYEEIAEDFNETRKKPLWPELVRSLEMVKDGQTVLDAGCGNGRILEGLKDKAISYLGIDASEKLINLAKENFLDRRTKAQYDFRVGNVLELGFLSEINFDFVFCVAVLHHLPGDDLRLAALRQLKNKIGKDGLLVLTAWNLWSHWKHLKLIFKFFVLRMLGKKKLDFGDIIFDYKSATSTTVSQRYYHAFTKRELKKLIKKSGLKIREYTKDKYNYYLILEK